MSKTRFWMSLVIVLGVAVSLFLGGCITTTDEATIRKGDAYLRSQNYRSAIVEYTNAMEYKPEDATLYLKRGNAYLELGQLEQAASDYENAIVINPELPEPYYGLGLIYQKRQEYREAILQFDKTIELSPDHLTTESGSFTIEHTNPLKGLAYAYRGDVRFSLGQYREAISDYTNALEIDPRGVEKYNRRGDAHLRLGEYEKAISDHSMAIALDPKNLFAYANRGLAYCRSGMYHKATADFTHIIQIQSNPDAIDYYNRGVTYSMLHQYNQAISDYAKAIELNPTSAIFYIRRGTDYAILGKTEEAKKDLLNAVKLSSELKTEVRELSDKFKLNLELDRNFSRQEAETTAQGPGIQDLEWKIRNGPPGTLLNAVSLPDGDEFGFELAAINEIEIPKEPVIQYIFGMAVGRKDVLITQVRSISHDGRTFTVNGRMYDSNNFLLPLFKGSGRFVSQGIVLPCGEREITIKVYSSTPPERATFKTGMIFLILKNGQFAVEGYAIDGKPKSFDLRLAGMYSSNMPRLGLTEQGEVAVFQPEYNAQTGEYPIVVRRLDLPGGAEQLAELADAIRAARGKTALFFEGEEP